MGIDAVMVSEILFPLINDVCFAEFIYLEMVDTHSSRAQFRVISSNSTFSWHVMTFLSFWGAYPASLVAFQWGIMVIFKVYSIVLKHNDEYPRTRRDHFLLQYIIY